VLLFLLALFISPFCFPLADIEAGQGMIASGRNMFSATDCPVNTYGVTGKMYGLAAAPCKPCPRNMITDGAARVNSSDACVNPDGFGYASEGESNATSTVVQLSCPTEFLRCF
jgi:hypothetical protein